MKDCVFFPDRYNGDMAKNKMLVELSESDPSGGDCGRDGCAPCDICGSSSPRCLQDPRMHRRYCFCADCGYIRTFAADLPSPEQERRRYLLHNNSPEDRGYVEYLSSFLSSALLPHLKPPAKILDFGSGPVPVGSNLLRSLGFEVDSYDPYFFPNTSWETRRYDAVLLIEVIEHIAEPLPVLHRLLSHLLPRGFLILRTMLHDGTPEFFDRWWYRRDPTHVSFFSRDTIEDITGLLSLELRGLYRECEIVLVRPGDEK